MPQFGTVGATELQKAATLTCHLTRLTGAKEPVRFRRQNRNLAVQQKSRLHSLSPRARGPRIPAKSTEERVSCSWRLDRRTTEPYEAGVRLPPAGQAGAPRGSLGQPAETGIVALARLNFRPPESLL
jgi:hypothetical protein